MSFLGIVGLGTMGLSLAFNIASKGYTISAFNRTKSKVDNAKLKAQEENINIRFFNDIKSFIESLRSPRIVFLVIKSGETVDMMIELILPLLTQNDIIVDCGNEYFEKTEKRIQYLSSKNIEYLGMGMSGGEYGARHGPSLMPGGSKIGYQLLETVLQSIAAQGPYGPCVSYLGPGGAGHYVKMVHNGIEYAEMECLAECYSLLRSIGQFSLPVISDIFAKWDKTDELSGYLMEITRIICQTPDDIVPNSFLLDFVSEKASSKGTGLWTVQNAAQVGVSVSDIAISLDIRYLSNIKNRYPSNNTSPVSPITSNPISNQQEFIDDLFKALFFVKIINYSQGFHLLQEMAQMKQWPYNIKQLAQLWTAGCIIRGSFLHRLVHLSTEETPLLLYQHPSLQKELKEYSKSLRRVCMLSLDQSLPIPCLMNALQYYDIITSSRLPTHLIAAQRDYFGHHMYERIDQEGVFHTNW